MPAENEGTITDFFVQLRSGDETAANKLWAYFFPQLLGLARKTLGHRPGGMADAEDAVQSAFVSFWQRTERGEFEGELNRDNLWSLLGVITSRKAMKQSRRERAQKRGGGKVLNETALRGPGSAGDGFNLDQLIGDLPAQEFDLHCQELLLMLDEDLRTFALLRLAGYKNSEIADRLDCTERKVERKLQLIRATWEQEVQ